MFPSETTIESLHREVVVQIGPAVVDRDVPRTTATNPVVHPSAAQVRPFDITNMRPPRVSTTSALLVPAAGFQVAARTARTN